MKERLEKGIPTSLSAKPKPISGCCLVYPCFLYCGHIHRDQNRKLMSTLYKTFRWIAVVPAAALVFFLTRVVVGFILEVSTFLNMEGHSYLISYIVNYGLALSSAGCFAVQAGAWIAPSGRKVVGIILAILIALLVSLRLLSDEVLEWWVISVGIIATLFGNFVGAIQAFEFDET